MPLTPTTGDGVIATVPVDIDVVLPADRVGMVLAQPHLGLTSSEPYHCLPEVRSRQLLLISETLEVSRRVAHGLAKTHFTVFPEYCVPGLDGVALVESALCRPDWPGGTFVIAGVDALSKSEFIQLAAQPNTHSALSDPHNSIREGAWINCCITWVKRGNGAVEKWLQPKLQPAWLEQDIRCDEMFHGTSVFIFRGCFEDSTPYSFLSLVCFDWIATRQTRKVWQRVLEGLSQQTKLGLARLSWAFVVQHNPRPSHTAFLGEVGPFFDPNTAPAVLRDRTCLVFANSAGRASPGPTDYYGQSGLVFSKAAQFSPPSCGPTFCNGGDLFRSSSLLTHFHDVLFRERGACIHSFSQVNPGSLVPGAAGKQIALENASVFPLGAAGSPRAPGGPVAAAVKWLNDRLDDIASLAKAYKALPLAQNAATAYHLVVERLRPLSAVSTERAVRLAAQGSHAKDPDNWTAIERQALEHLVNTSSILGIAVEPPDFRSGPAHGLVIIDGTSIDLLAVRGPTHEDCVAHSMGVVASPQRKLLLISRDDDNNYFPDRFGSFLNAGPVSLGQDTDITDPSSGRLHLDYRTLLDAFQASGTKEQLNGAIGEALGC